MYTHKPGTVCKNEMIGHKGSEALPLGRALKCQKIITVGPMCLYTVLKTLPSAMNFVIAFHASVDNA